MSFKTILEPSTYEIVIEKSKFICHLFPVRSVEEAEACILKVRKEHYNATHNVPAYLCGADYKYSDDGEPAQTAGAPMLTMLQKEGYNNILAVVTRYFGGIKLGTGGLVRAYTSSVKEALAHTHVVEIAFYANLVVALAYAMLGKVEYYFRENDIHVQAKEYGEAIRMSLYVKPDRVGAIRADLIEMTGGNVEIEEQGEILLTSDYGAYTLS